MRRARGGLGRGQGAACAGRVERGGVSSRWVVESGRVTGSGSVVGNGWVAARSARVFRKGAVACG